MNTYTYIPTSSRNTGRIRIKTLVLSLLLFVVIAVPALYKGYPMVKGYLGQQNRDAEANDVEVVFEKPVVETTVVKAEQTTSIPASAKLNVPWTVQAPNGNWNDATGNGESCEEAALLMNHYYLKGKKFDDGKIPKTIAVREIDKMIDYQKKHYGYKRDAHSGNLDMKRLGEFANDYYGYKYKVIKNFSKSDIKRETNAGNVVIVPVMTKTLRTEGGGHYAAGDVYHVFPIVGYKSNGVIANDNGFTAGRNWFYKWDVLFRAVDNNEHNSPARSALVIYDN